MDRVKINIKDLSVFYGCFEAVKKITFPVYEKKITAIIGPSGCGKSTLLRALNRIHDLYPDVTYRGEAIIYPDGLNIVDTKTDPLMIRHRIGMVFQKPNPFPKSIFENVAYGLKIRGITNSKELQERVEISLRRAWLWDEVKDDLNKSAYALSGGQQQRLCIARAIAVEPEVLLFDEPTSALDPIATAKIEELIVQLKETITIVIVTHNMQQAARVSDYTAFMYLGELVEYGPTEKIFTRPEKKLTEDYITGRFG